MGKLFRSIGISIETHTNQENRITNFVQRLTRDTLGWKSSTVEAAGGWNKGALTTSLCLFIQHLSTIWDLANHGDEMSRLIVSWQDFLFGIRFRIVCAALHQNLSRMSRRLRQVEH